MTDKLACSAIMSTKRPSLLRVLSETSRIISAHFRHYLALSALFLFPMSLFSTIYPFLLDTTSVHSHYRRFLSTVSTPDSEIPPVVKSQILIQALYFLFVLIVNICAVSSFTRSTIDGFQDRPVKFVTSLKSILVSFLPLLATKLVYLIILGLILFAFSLFMGVLFFVLALQGVNLDTTNIYFLVFGFLMAAVIAVFVIYLAVELSLMNPIVVIESQWGFAPLKRSWYLVKGMRGVVFSMVMIFGILSGILSLWQSNMMSNKNQDRTGWVVVQMVVFAGFSTILSLYSLVADTVLFVYCKALHGESVPPIDDKSGAEYVKLSVDL